MENEVQVMEGVRELQIGGEMDVSKYVQTIGQVSLSDEQKAILYAPVKDEEVEIRPDGLVYLPWVHYVKKLHNAFGMDWALVPKGMPLLQDNFVYWGFFMVVKGSLMGFAIGQQEYYATNDRMTWGDACEGAKSNALMRLCKQVGIGLELWDPQFNRRWVKEYATFEWSEYKGKKQKIWWRKDGERPWYLDKKGNGITEKEKTHWSQMIHDTITNKDYPEASRNEWLEWLKGNHTTAQLKEGYDRVLKVLDRQQKAIAEMAEPKQAVETESILGDGDLLEGA